VRVFISGGTGFIGGTLARKLRVRGDHVMALVRSPEKAGELGRIGCDLVPGDLSDPKALRSGLDGCDAAFHVAAMYKVGIRESERPAMFEANVGGTERVLDAATDAGVARTVYVSTIGYFGNTRGQVVDETAERTPGDWLSAYDETKYLAHQAAVERQRQGVPILIAMPGGVYGPGDQSDLGTFIERILSGWLKVLIFPETGFNFLHVEDATDGILLVHDRGSLGQAYILGGERATIRVFIETVARAAGRKPPCMVLPAGLAKASIPLGPLIGRIMGTGPNLREIIKAAEGVTYWASDAKARRDLGYAPRDLETGLRQTVEALGR
jgi:dihydroflavonol-4-reductase